MSFLCYLNTMSSHIMRGVLTRLYTASLNVAKKNDCRYYPKIKQDVRSMTDDEVESAITETISFLEAPEYSHIMFRYYNKYYKKSKNKISVDK